MYLCDVDGGLWGSPGVVMGRETLPRAVHGYAMQSVVHMSHADGIVGKCLPDCEAHSNMNFYSENVSNILSYCRPFLVLAVCRSVFA